MNTFAEQARQILVVALVVFVSNQSIAQPKTKPEKPVALDLPPAKKLEPKIEPVKKNSLIGLWGMEDFVVDGERRFERKDLHDTRLMFTKSDFYLYKVNGLERYHDAISFNEFGYEVNDSKSPSHYTTYNTIDGRRISKLCIAEFRDGMLYIASSTARSDRPSSFVERNLNILVYSRVKPRMIADASLSLPIAVHDHLKSTKPKIESAKIHSLVGLWSYDDSLEDRKRTATKDEIAAGRLLLTKDTYYAYNVDKEEKYVDDVFVHRPDGYEIDDSKKPTHFSQYYLKDSQRKMTPFIAEIQDDKLTLASRDNDKGRPESFTEKELNVRTYSRVRK